MHFGNHAVDQHPAADQLDVEVTHAQQQIGCLANQGKRMGDEFVAQSVTP